MKSVLISIQPKWCELIASGKKTIEVRKSAPKLQTPFKCYIYKTLGKKSDSFSRNIQGYFNCGKVIGEFVCDRICKIPPQPAFGDYDFREIYALNDLENYFSLSSTCLTQGEIIDYGKGKPLYGWHISDLKIYDKPKELTEFYTICIKPPTEITCRECPNKAEFCFNKKKPLKRPYQSWGYVEEQ